jgi:hypothetical protein
MRAPDEKFVGYDAAQWTKISETIAPLGVNADDVMVDDIRLRDVLEDLARFYGGRTKPPTPKQRAHRLGVVLGEIETLRGKLDTLRLLSHETHAAKQALTDLADRLRSKRDMLTARGSAAKHNRRQDFRNDFVIDLVALWPKIARRPLRKHRLRFVYACTAPVFPGTTDSAIKHIIERPERAS